MTASAVVFRRAFVVSSIMWVVLLPAATFAASRPHGSSFLYAASVAVYGAGAVLCHQLAARSFFLWSAQMPVCARCLGIYAGCALAAAFASSALLRDTHPRSAKSLVLIGLVPNVATLLFEWTTGVTPSNATRALAGVPLGAAIGWIVVRSFDRPALVPSAPTGPARVDGRVDRVQGLR